MLINELGNRIAYTYELFSIIKVRRKIVRIPMCFSLKKKWKLEIFSVTIETLPLRLISDATKVFVMAMFHLTDMSVAIIFYGQSLERTLRLVSPETSNL